MPSVVFLDLRALTPPLPAAEIAPRRKGERIVENLLVREPQSGRVWTHARGPASAPKARTLRTRQWVETPCSAGRVFAPSRSWRTAATPSMVRLMASRVITQLISDLSGEEIGDGQGESVQFGYRGTNYTIDLTADEAAAFDEAIASYIENATQQGRARATRKSAGRTQTGDAKAIREWAQGQGIDVPARGRIPAELREQYEAAN